MAEQITAMRGRYYRDEASTWRHSETKHKVAGARDMTLDDLYPDLVIVTTNGSRLQWVLVPDVLVRDHADLAWVREVADGPTSRYDTDGGRTGTPTAGWTNVWPVPVLEWDLRAAECQGIWIAGVGEA